MYDWSDIEKIDAHMHILPDEVHGTFPDMDNEFQNAKADLYVKLMERFNIKASVIMPFNDPGMMSVSLNLEDVHGNLLDIKQQYPGKFCAFADIDPARSLAESSRHLFDSVEKYQLDGLKIHPQNSEMDIGSDYNVELLKIAEVLKLPVAIHSYPNTIESPDAAKKVAKLINRFPKLTFIVSHMGAFQWKELLDCSAYVDLSAILPAFARELGMNECKRILHSFTADRLIFASDFPCSRILQSEDILTAYFEILNAMDFSETEARKIAVDNITSILSE